MVVLYVLAALAVLVVALVGVGREAFTLAAQPHQSVFDLDEAVDFVADRLPEETTARLSYDDVRALLRWHLEYLDDRGVPTRRDLTRGGPVVIEDDEGVGWVIGRAAAEDLVVDDIDVALVVHAEMAYLAAIGALGGEVADPLELSAGDEAPTPLEPGDSPPTPRPEDKSRPDEDLQ